MDRNTVSCKLGDLSERITKGSTPTSYGFQYKQEGINFVKAENIDANGNIFGIIEFIDEKTNTFLGRSILKSGDLLFSIAGTIGRVGIVKNSDLPANTNQALAIIRLAPGHLNLRFLFYYISAHSFRKSALNKIVGVGRANLSLENLSEFNIQLPGRPEQDRIANLIEESFSDLDNAIENLKKAQEQLRVYRQAVLKCAFTGKLSNDGNVWEIKPLGQAGHVVSGNTPKGVNEIYSMGEIPFYKVSDMNTEGNEVYLRKSKINLSANDCKKLKLKTYPAGTVVFPKRGGAILTNKKRILSKESAFDLNLMGVVPNDNVLERFLFNWFLLLDLGKLCDGSNVPQINHGDIEPLDFPLAPTEIQKKVIGEIEARLSVCKNMEDALDENLCKAEALRQSILKKAFEGKLTEQWRTEHKELISGENSAEALLKKIKAEKEALQAKPKGNNKHD